MVRKLEQKYKPTGIALMPDLRSEQIDKMYKMDEV